MRPFILVKLCHISEANYKKLTYSKKLILEAYSNSALTKDQYDQDIRELFLFFETGHGRAFLF